MLIYRWFKRLLKMAITIFIVATVVLFFIPVQLSVPWQSQYPQLPNGCESVSAAVSLSYFGEQITAEGFVDHYLPRGNIGVTNPSEAYIGNPYGDGYYCYPKALVKGMNSYLSENHSSLRAATHPFVPFTEIIWRLHMKQPVIAWITVDGKIAQRDHSVTWDIRGGGYHPYKNLHVVTIDGMNKFQIHVEDSINGSRWISLKDFLPMYYSMRMRAVTFHR